MPWCPKCKTEYREGFTICADCGSRLVDEEQIGGLVPLTFGEAEQMEALSDFLKYSGIRKLECRAEDSDGQVALLVAREELEKSAAAVRVFLTQENQWRDSGGQEDTDNAPGETGQIREAVAANRSIRGSSLYQDSSQRADENRSSGWILLIVGFLGLVLTVLGFLGIIPLHPSNPYLFYGVLGAVFALFLVAGAMSIKDASHFAKKAESENSLRNTMLEWCRENLCAEEIDRYASGEDIPDEVLFLNRTAYIRERLNHQFVNLDQDFLDRFVDDHVYGMIFEERPE